MQRLLRICKNPGGTTPNKQTEEEKAYVGKSEGKMGKSDSVFSAYGGLESTKKYQGQNITEINQKINNRRGETMRGGSSQTKSVFIAAHFSFISI